MNIFARDQGDGSLNEGRSDDLDSYKVYHYRLYISAI
jgi:hypothetical protein